MIDHNIVVVNGKEYKAVAEVIGCDGCAFYGHSCAGIKCTYDARSDGCSVIFKPNYRPKASELKW